MVYPTDDLVIRARRAIREATELVDRLRQLYAREGSREPRRADGEDGERPSRTSG